MPSRSWRVRASWRVCTCEADPGSRVLKCWGARRGRQSWADRRCCACATQSRKQRREGQSHCFSGITHSLLSRNQNKPRPLVFRSPHEKSQQWWPWPVVSVTVSGCLQGTLGDVVLAASRGGWSDSQSQPCQGRKVLLKHNCRENIPGQHPNSNKTFRNTIPSVWPWLLRMSLKYPMDWPAWPLHTKQSHPAWHLRLLISTYADIWATHFTYIHTLGIHRLPCRHVKTSIRWLYPMEGALYRSFSLKLQSPPRQYKCQIYKTVLKPWQFSETWRGSMTAVISKALTCPSLWISALLHLALALRRTESTLQRLGWAWLSSQESVGWVNSGRGV